MGDGDPAGAACRSSIRDVEAFVNDAKLAAAAA
jgi:hypothetical protein